MQRFRTLLFPLIFISSIIFAQDAIDFSGKEEDPDMDALRKWIREKRMISVKEIGGDLSLSGEVRFEIQGTHESKDHVPQRGVNSPSEKPVYASDVEVNVMLDYKADRTWASIKLEFDNDLGQLHGTVNHLVLEKAYLGVRLVNGETFVFDFELGRRFLAQVYDSKLEFGSIYDGFVFRFNKAFEKAGDLYVNVGALIADDRTHHYPQVGEIGMLRIANTGIYAKYSFINWKKGFSNPTKDLRYNYRISQWILGYQFNVTRFSTKFVKLYSGFLWNHSADRQVVLVKDQPPLNYGGNYGFYVGLSAGQIRKKGDWALDINYQYVAPQAIPDFDSLGIKRGNATGVGLYTMRQNGTGGPTTLETAVGNCNFHGFNIDFLYAFTNNITMFQSFKLSRNQNNRVGPKMTYHQYEIEFIYAF